MRYSEFTRAALTGFFLLTAAVSLRAAAPAATPATTINISHFTFTPAQLTVKVGTTVTWTNLDDEPHSVISATEPRILKSQPLDTSGSYSIVFDKPGVYTYFCSLHPYMQGTVTVN